MLPQRGLFFDRRGCMNIDRQRRVCTLASYSQALRNVDVISQYHIAQNCNILSMVL